MSDARQLFFLDARHGERLLEDGRKDGEFEKWRMKERMKTVSVALVLCMNIGVDPPDVLKTSPCARLECWIDPLSLPPSKCLEAIGKTLQIQYERWQTRARYKQCLDPTVEEVRKLCCSLRRAAKDERVLFHYNGHGVPRPTANGEIWVFNKNYTQYIPCSVYDLQTWMGSPSIYVFDCSAAGLIVQFQQYADQRKENHDCIILAACAGNENLPMNPSLPADVFTSCLTTPIKMALRWFCSHSVLTDASADLIDKIPGRLTDRRTPMGELNWIFTAITDTIAWNVLPRDLFQKLFRQDLLVASLFRNFLLAERIMRSANCTPISVPQLPPTYNHPMWQSWDLAADNCLSQLPLAENAVYNFSPFFAEQLTAFEVWLEMGRHKKQAPEQLPIVLQVLLSQVHRLRALELLGRFLDLGPWAANLALSVGIFPYVLKLLQSPATELRQILVFIWAKILALDKSCQVDLIKDNGHSYFLNVLSSGSVTSEQRTMATFVLTVIVDNFKRGQQACLNGNLLTICKSHLSPSEDGASSDPLLRRWLCICVGKLWQDFEDARRAGIREVIHEQLCSLLKDAVPEVRAAAVFALGMFFGGDRSDLRISLEHHIAFALLQVTADGSVMVRRELVIALSRFMASYRKDVGEAAAHFIEEERRMIEGADSDDASTPIATGMDEGRSSIYDTVWKVMMSMTVDPFESGVASLASQVVAEVRRPLDAARARHAAAAAPPQPESAKRRKGKEKEKRTDRGKKRTSLLMGGGGLHRARSGAISDEARVRKVASMGEISESSMSNSMMGDGDDGDWEASLALDSTFYQWSCKQFSTPTMSEGTEGSKYVDDAGEAERQWRKQRNERLLREAEVMQKETTRLDDQIAILDNEAEMALLLLFDPFEPYLIVADENDGISVWNYEDGAKATCFSNRNVEGSRATSMRLLNEEQDVALLMVATDDGVVKVWKDFYDTVSAPQLVTAWRALPELVPGGRGSGLVVEWQQFNGQLFASGDVGVVRVWDMERELAAQDIPTAADSCVTSLSSDRAGSPILMAGCGDGSVRLFDVRMHPRDSLVQTYSEHVRWVVNVHMQQGGNRELMSGSLSGDIRLWDMRALGSTRTILAHQSGMTALAMHDHAPTIASGSHNQYIKAFGTSGESLGMIRYHEGFLGQRIGPVSCLAFHPHSLFLAAGSTDSIISIYAGDQYRR